MLQALSELLTQKPQYDWSSVQWHETVQWHESKKLPKNAINKQPVGVQAELEAVLDYIVGDIEAEAYQDETAFRIAQK